MSWFGAIKKTEDPREERRKQLERERSQRKEARIQQQQLQAALLAQKKQTKLVVIYLAWTLISWLETTYN